MIASKQQKAKLLLGATIDPSELSRSAFAKWLKTQDQEFIIEMMLSYLGECCPVTGQCEAVIEAAWPTLEKALVSWGVRMGYSNRGVVQMFECEREWVLS